MVCNLGSEADQNVANLVDAVISMKGTGDLL